MTDISKPDTLTLTDEEKQLLKIIYQSRLKIFSGAFVAMFFGAIYAVGKSTGTARQKRIMANNPYDYEIMGHTLTPNELSVLMAVFIYGIIGFFAVRIFVKRIYPYKKDSASGLKEVVYKTVIDKKYFPATGQFFISFDDPNYMHHEVDADFYHAVAEGSTVSLFRGLYSKYVFQKDGRFTLM